MSKPICPFSASSQEFLQWQGTSCLPAKRQASPMRSNILGDRDLALGGEMLKFSSEASDLARRLSKDQEPVGKKEYSALAKKVTEAVSPWLELLKEVPENPIFPEEAFLQLHELASAFESGSKTPRKVWRRLCPKIQKLFSILLPYSTFPGNRSKEAGPPDEPEESGRGPASLKFEDGCRFEASLVEEGTGIKRFALQKFPNVFLTAISDAPEGVLDMVNRYIEAMPPAIDELFRASALKEEVQSFDGTPHLQREISAKIHHQILALKMWYMQMLLESIGIAVDRPDEVSKTGEWYISSSPPPKPLTDEILAACKPHEKEKIAIAIRAFFEAERRWGLELLGEGDRTVCSLQHFVLGLDGQVYLRSPLNTLRLIEGDVNERHSKIKKKLEKNLGRDVFEQVFAPPFSEPLKHEEVAKELGLLVDKGYLAKEDLLNQSALAAEIFFSLNESPLNAEKLKGLPWDLLDTPEQLLAYLRTYKALGENMTLAFDPDALSAKVLELLLQIPSGLFPFESQSAFLKKLPGIVEKDGELRNEIFASVIGCLLHHLLKQPDVSFEDVLQNLIESVESRLQLQVEKGALFLPRLKEQKIAPFSVSYSYDKEPEELKPYLNGILWAPLIDRINSLLFPGPPSLSIQHRFTLLRGLQFSSDKGKTLSDQTTAKLFEIAHPIMMINEKKRKAARIRERLNAYCE